MNLDRKLLIIGSLWPSFWMACGLSGIVFSAIDPSLITSQIGLTELSHLGAYTIGFFFFWAVCAWSGFFSIIFSRKAINK
ncbi:MAG: hypothetical protein A6F70_07555 [Cycloclasticus sp. symbiont of Bathymodiolus heckerae]|nr:MAG: hypothetical protein A6F70_07555 [Cycloclasticus sp. symbiont of Bathymodiolus heckerae]